MVIFMIADLSFDVVLTGAVGTFPTQVGSVRNVTIFAAS
ncbi:hypothetical protein SAMN05443287_10316 [Micromonospora phaseoli]|uniref:Uncharacterized protein n=1 Tax=Micromonospora phaseoli TaxID=1144548 RepID=A0A1H6W4Z2_9ACTN|nr:hypothetical protein CLV64_10216 [Micromonospora phaseoli]SEJ11973.1 hypothetical protein SAMN05443287_10316 [Micromonospora phaseoli]